MDSEILSLLRKRREGLSFQKIARELHLSPREKQVLRKSLKRLEGQGIILRLKRKYYVPAKANLTQGTFSLSLRGFGFVTPEDRRSEDIFIPARYTAGARRGDLVEVLFREKGKKGKPEGRIIRVIKVGRKTLLGLYSERGGSSFVLPFDSPFSEEFPLIGEKPPSLRPGMAVEVDRKSHRLVDVLGLPEQPGVDTRVIIRMFDLASSFSKETLEETDKISSEITVRDRKERKDYRNWTSMTIDGENAQDFDDAVSVKKLKNGHFRLGVHIADVSHFVRPGTSLDDEAHQRGTSVYFPDLTLPMLPEKLSNNICSLRPRQNRLTVSVLLEFGRNGEMVRAEFHPSLIRTAARMTYDSVFRIFEGDRKERSTYSHLVPDLLMMRELASLLKQRREEQGSLDFDLLEPELVYKEGSLHSIVAFERNQAHQLIEEFMLAANEAVARFLIQKDAPLLFRIHPRPDLKDLERLGEILAHFGLSLPVSRKIGSRHLQRVLKEVEGKPEEKFVSLQVLKSLKLAVYSEENAGHYGLAKEDYTHFTSPIRRYPDLVVHRILKDALQGEGRRIQSLSSLALHCSTQERAAEEAERDLLEWRIYRFLKGKLGEEIDGIITDITRAGLIVELDGYFVDGLIAYSDLGGDYYRKRSEKTLVGRRTGRTFVLGSRVKVIIASVNPVMRRMSLVLSQDAGRKAR